MPLKNSNDTIGNRTCDLSKMILCLNFDIHYVSRVVQCIFFSKPISYVFRKCSVRGSADKSLARPGRKKLQRPNSGFI